MVTENQQDLTLLQYPFLPEKFEDFRTKYAKNISEIRKRIYAASVAVGNSPDCGTSSGIFSEYGIDCSVKNLSVKRINVYQIVNKTAEKFGLSMPKIVVSNNILPNAAAAGPSASSGTVMITLGILTQLEEDELFSVIGHEMSHLKAHDSLAMSFLSSLEFLLCFYVFLPLISSFDIILLALVYRCYMSHLLLRKVFGM